MLQVTDGCANNAGTQARQKMAVSFPDSQSGKLLPPRQVLNL